MVAFGVFDHLDRRAGVPDAQIYGDRLRLIAAALSRLDEGEYGYCMSCGIDIPEKRLAVDAAAAQCVDCAK